MITPLLLATLLSLQDGDWPTYRADAHRSGVASTSLGLPLAGAWTARVGGAPQPAWPGPAKRDAYSRVEDLSPRLLFDRAFHVAVAGGVVVFGSSADEHVHALDAETGQELWSWATEGPVRFAPALHAGRAYVGSDDGAVYCLDARTGALEWSRRVAPLDRRVPGNGRMISVWPVRTGVVVHDGAVYATAGIFPSERVYVAAFEAGTGDTRWLRDFTDMGPQGYLLATAEHLYVPSGRDAPFVFDRASGERLRQLGGQGGTFALVAGGDLIVGPGKTGQMSQSSAGGAQLAEFSGNHMIATAGVSYLHTSTELSALERERYLTLSRERDGVSARRGELSQRLSAAAPADVPGLEEELQALADELVSVRAELRACLRWRRVCREPFALVQAGDALLAGGDGAVAAYHVEDGRELWRAPVDGRAWGLAVADGRLFVSTESGAIHCFAAEETR